LRVSSSSPLSIGLGSGELFDVVTGGQIVSGGKGDVLLVNGSGVVSGGLIDVYWDSVGDWDPSSCTGLLNSTVGTSAGVFEVQIPVPNCLAGVHYVWVVAPEQRETARSTPFTVEPKLIMDERVAAKDELVVRGYSLTPGDSISLTINDASNTATLGTDPADLVSDSRGSFEATVTLPNWSDGDYFVNSTDESGGEVSITVTMGTVISISPVSGPEGTIIKVSGRGFTPSGQVAEGDVSWDNWTKVQLISNKTSIDSNGRFSTYVVVPSRGLGVHTLEVTEGSNSDSEDFEVTGLAGVTLSAVYGEPGTTVTVEGTNFPRWSGRTVKIYFASVKVAGASTDSNGRFSTGFVVPSFSPGDYTLTANCSDEVNVSTTFHIGYFQLSVDPPSGPSGIQVNITGSGFSAGDFDLLMGGYLVEALGTVSAGGVLYESFYIPSLPVGSYAVFVNDSRGYLYNSSFSVSATTSLETGTGNAAVGYNLTFTGEDFVRSNGTGLVWVVSNSTWSMEISDEVLAPGGSDKAFIDGEGGFTAVWNVSDSLMVGRNYTIKACDSLDPNTTRAETRVSVVEVSIDARPNAGTYHLGDYMTFTIESNFPKPYLLLEIWDSSGALFYTSSFDAGDWVSLLDTNHILYPSQVDDVSGGPYRIPRGAKTGLWTWRLIDGRGALLDEGSFEVKPSETDIIAGKLSGIGDSLLEVAVDLDDLGANVFDVGAGLGDVRSQIGIVDRGLDQFRSELAMNLSQGFAPAAGETESLRNSAEGLVEEFGEILSDNERARVSAEDARAAADSAKASADEAKNVANNQYSLFYSLIGLSVVATVASSLLLMQLRKEAEEPELTVLE
jgi:hypothetical protein